MQYGEPSFESFESIDETLGEIEVRIALIIYRLGLEFY